MLSRYRAARDERGALALVVAMMATVLFLVAALVVDLGLARDTRRGSQNTSDSSALAAANVLYAGGVVDFVSSVSAAKTYAATNFGTTAADWLGCTDAAHLVFTPDPANTCISFDSATVPTRVRVVTPTRDVKTSLGQLANVSRVPVSSTAEASLLSRAGPCGLCLLGYGLHDFGTVNAYAINTSVAMNGTMCEKKLFVVAPAPPETLTVQNGASIAGGCHNDGNISPAPTVSGTTVADPLATLQMPDVTGLPNKGTQNPCTGGPGVYANFNNFTTCSLSPGLYVVTGYTSVSGTGHDLSGTGVTLYFACGTSAAVVPCTSANSWSFDMSSQGVHLNITAPTSAATAQNGALPNVAIVADRGWTGDLSFQGGGGSGTTTGSIYLARGTLHYGGNTDNIALDAMIVADDFSGNGNSANLSMTVTEAFRPLVRGTTPYLLR